MPINNFLATFKSAIFTRVSKSFLCIFKNHCKIVYIRGIFRSSPKFNWMHLEECPKIQFWEVPQKVFRCTFGNAQKVFGDTFRSAPKIQLEAISCIECLIIQLEGI
jgi:hypothetical protein